MIEINNLTETKVDGAGVKKIVQKVLDGEKAGKKADLSIALLGPGRMRKLNKQYRKKNTITDVLAFPDKEIPFEKFKIGRAKECQGLGEIVICLRELKKNAKRFGKTFEQELARVLIHGVLHLLGYDHEKSADAAKKMQEKEQKYLEILEIV